MWIVILRFVFYKIVYYINFSSYKWTKYLILNPHRIGRSWSGARTSLSVLKTTNFPKNIKFLVIWKKFIKIFKICQHPAPRFFFQASSLYPPKPSRSFATTKNKTSSPDPHFSLSPSPIFKAYVGKGLGEVLKQLRWKRVSPKHKGPLLFYCLSVTWYPNSWSLTSMQSFWSKKD